MKTHKWPNLTLHVVKTKGQQLVAEHEGFKPCVLEKDFKKHVKAVNRIKDILGGTVVDVRPYRKRETVLSGRNAEIERKWNEYKLSVSADG